MPGGNVRARANFGNCELLCNIICISDDTLEKFFVQLYHKQIVRSLSGTHLIN